MVSLAALVTARPLITARPDNTFPNIVAAIRNVLFCFFASFLIVSLIRFISNLHSSSDLTFFIISSISSFEVINDIVPDPKIFFRIAASVAHAAAVNPNGIKTLLADGVSTFLINGLRKLKNPPF